MIPPRSPTLRIEEESGIQVTTSGSHPHKLLSLKDWRRGGDNLGHLPHLIQARGFVPPSSLIIMIYLFLTTGHAGTVVPSMDVQSPQIE
jgi:hypothetical protein